MKTRAREKLAEAYKQNLIDSKTVQPVLVDILPAKNFTPPKRTIRSIIKKIPSAINSTATTAEEISG